MVQTGGCDSPVGVARHLRQQATNSPRGSPRAQRRPREMSVVSDVESVKSFTSSLASSSPTVSVDRVGGRRHPLESGYGTITDVACKGPLW